MKSIKNFLASFVLITITIMLLSFDLPKGWFKRGSKPESYDMGIDSAVTIDGKKAATIKSMDKKIKGFGTLMQECLADKFIGKRVRMSALVKSKDVKGWAGLWMRIDQKNSRKPLGFDNMRDRSIKGTNEWAKYEVVLDVSLNASQVAYGALLEGTGQIWFAKLNFEIVDSTISVTGHGEVETIPSREPLNLDFEK